MAKPYPFCRRAKDIPYDCPLTGRCLCAAAMWERMKIVDQLIRARGGDLAALNGEPMKAAERRLRYLRKIG